MKGRDKLKESKHDTLTNSQKHHADSKLRTVKLQMAMEDKRLHKLLLVLAAITLSLLLFLASGAPVQSQAELGFKQDALSLRLKPTGAATDKKCDRSNGELKTLSQRVKDPHVQTAGATVFLSNSGPETLTGLRFSPKLQFKKVGLSALLRPGFYRFYDPDTEPIDAWVCSSQTSIAPDDAKPLDLWVEVDPSPEWDQLESWTFTGFLSVSAEQQGVKPATIKFNLTDTSPWYKSLFNWILFLTLVVTLALGLGVYFRKYWKERELRLRNRLATKITVNLDLKDSWASKIAAVGGILGTVLAASILPEATFLLAKEQYIALSVLFGLLVVFATVMHNVLQRVGSYLFASVVTIGAAWGQIVTAILLFEEVGIQGTMSPFGVRLLQALFIVAAGLVGIIAYKRLDPPAQDPPVPARAAIDGTYGAPHGAPPAVVTEVPMVSRITAAL